MLNGRGQPDESYIRRQLTLEMLRRTRLHCSDKLWVIGIGTTAAKSPTLDCDSKVMLDDTLILLIRWMALLCKKVTYTLYCCPLMCCHEQMSHLDNLNFLDESSTPSHFIKGKYADESSIVFCLFIGTFACYYYFTKICCKCKVTLVFKKVSFSKVEPEVTSRQNEIFDLQYWLVKSKRYYHCNNYVFFKVCFCVDAWAWHHKHSHLKCLITEG